MAQITGKATLLFDRPPRIIGAASIVGNQKKVTDRSDISSTVSRKIQNSAKTHGRRQKASYSFGPHEKYWKKRVSQKKKSAIFLPVIFWPRASPPLTASWNCRFLCSDSTVPVPPAVKVSPWLPCVSVPVMPDV